MVAVLAVVINHLTGHPQGGFVGVDVFFVISGYLITSMLVRDLGRGAGPIRYIGDFYRRRIRRLMPAALAVIVVTVVVAHHSFTAARFAATRSDGLWSAAFWANWHFAAAGTNYFAASGPTSPLQHYWSLSVEEQFYVIWPIALFLISVVAVSHSSLGKRRAIVAAASMLTIIASLLYGLHQSTTDPATAYFSTFSRGWELALGALVACALPYLRATRTVLTLMSWLGAALIVLALFVSHGGSGFPVPGAVLPCIGAALVIAAVSNDGVGAANVILTNRIAVFVGDISYSVYLVHFPVIIMLPSYVRTGTAEYYVAALTLSFGLAIGLYGLVEKPILTSGWLQPKSAARDTAVAASEPGRARRWAIASVVVLAASVAVVASGPAPGTVTARTAQQIRDAAEAPSSASSTSPATPQADALTAELRQALLATSWPQLTPSYNAVFSGPPEPADSYECGETQLSSDCVWGDLSAPPDRTAYLVGDSTSVAYDPAFQAAASLLPGWKIRAAGGFSCNFGDSVVADAVDTFSANCAQRQQAVLADIKQVHPALLIVTQVSGSADYLNSTGAALAKIAGSYGKVVMLPAPPLVPDPRSCYTPSSSPAACVAHIPSTYTPDITRETAFAAENGGILIPTEDWFAVNDYCPPFVKGVPVKRDTTHITAAYSSALAPVLAEALRTSGALG